MFRRIFSRPPLVDAVQEDVLSMCRQQQIELLQLPRHLRRDIGLECDCLSTCVSAG